MMRAVAFWAAFMVAFLCGSLSAVAQVPPGDGAIDKTSYAPEQRELVVLGWVASAKPQVFVTRLRVDLGSHTVYQSGRWQPEQRVDVAQAKQRPDWENTGYRIVARIPGGIACDGCAVRVQARLSDGQTFELHPGADAAPITTQAHRPRWLPGWLILALLALPAAMVLAHVTSAGQPLVKRWCGAQPVMAAAMLAFITLVATGTTGSSLPLLLHGIDAVQGQAAPWLGQLRPIRSDEWEVITPMALSQQAHQPGYPVVNRNLGTGGQNMLVVGMSAVPVAHPSALAKPATWGFFALPLPQALAWYWWFPFFGCFGVLWALLWRMGISDWRASAAWAAAIAYSPYSVAFSGWPAYLLFFGASGLLCGMHIVRSKRWSHSIFGATGLGLAIAGYTLVLYPAWQISLGYLLAIVALGWGWNNRQTLSWGRVQILGGLLGVGIAALILLAWWQDAAPAVHAIQATVYPGQRSTSVGGDIDPWYLIKGLLSPSSMYQTPPLMDASDAGSIIWLFVPLALAAAWQVWRRKKTDAVGLALAAYIAVALCYVYIGLPEPLARFSLWGRVTSYRMDLALGLAQALLLAWLWGREHTGPRWFAALAAALSLGAMAWCWQTLPGPIAQALSPSFLWLSALAWAAAAYWIGIGRLGAATGLIVAWTLASALPFNPLVQAPPPMAVAPALASHFAPGDRVAVIGERRWSLLLPAAGVAVVNAVHYHPPAALWHELDPENLEATVHNRYQRLLLELQAQPAGQRPYVLRSPRLDEVVLSLDPTRFTFQRLQASHVLAPLQDAQALRTNPGLAEVARGPHWVLMRVNAVLGHSGT